jgi:hypothetical protein
MAGAGSGTWAVIYAAIPPNPVTGLNRGQRDCSLAHVEAERAALAACSNRADCEIVATACGTR